MKDANFSNNNSSTSEKKDALVWLNAIYPEDKEIQDKLFEIMDLIKAKYGDNLTALGTPVKTGTPLDSVKPYDMKGSDDWRKEQENRNNLLTSLVDFGMNGVEEGGVSLVPMITYIRHVKPAGATEEEGTKTFSFTRKAS